MKEMSKKDLEDAINFIEKNSRVYRDEDLKRIWLNPPPSDGRCMCCGKHISELKPYGKAGDPLVGDFDGVLLLKRFRQDGPYSEKAEKAVKEADKHYANEGYKNPEEWMIKKYGEKEGKKLFYSYMLYCQISKSWECRECAIKDSDEYFKELERRYRKKA